MNPILSILTVFEQLKNDIRARFNAALKELGPVEQVEGASAAANVLREIEWAQKRVEQIGTDIDATMKSAEAIVPGFAASEGEAVPQAVDRMFAAMMANCASAAVSKAIQAGTHMPVEDHQTALQNAVQAAVGAKETEMNTAFSAKLKVIELAATRRKELAATLGAISAVLSDADLAADDFQAKADKLTARVETMKALGITEEHRPKSFQSLLACALDEDGTSQFDSRIEMIRESGATPFAASAPAATPAAGAPAVKSGEESARRSIPC